MPNPFDGYPLVGLRAAGRNVERNITALGLERQAHEARLVEINEQEHTQLAMRVAISEAIFNHPDNTIVLDEPTRIDFTEKSSASRREDQS